MPPSPWEAAVGAGAMGGECCRRQVVAADRAPRPGAQGLSGKNR
jgi:hypothetical protein